MKEDGLVHRYDALRRRGVWRLRILGQGYDDDLAAFAVRHGVEVDG